MIKRVAAWALSVTAAGIIAIKTHESGGPPILEAYDDGVGVMTICDGHTKGVTKGMRATLSQCEEWLREDISDAGRAVGRCTKAPITQRQYDALVSLAYNIGGNLYCGTDLVALLNAGDCLAAAREFNAAPKLDRKTGRPIIYQGRPLRDRATGKVLLAPGEAIKKFTTGNGIPMAGLIKRRADERARFEADCAAPGGDTTRPAGQESRRTA